MSRKFRVALGQLSSESNHFVSALSYMRVVEEGLVQAGDLIALIEDAPENPTVRRLWQLAYFEEESFEECLLALRLRKAGIPLEH